MVMILSTNYQSKAQSTNLARNADGKQEENCWRNVESDSRTNRLRNGQSNCSSNVWRNGDAENVGEPWRKGHRDETSSVSWRKEEMIKGTGMEIIRNIEGEEKRNWWRNEKSKSMVNFWQNGENNAIGKDWRCSSKEELDSIFWGEKKQDHKTDYIWKNPAGQQVSPLNSEEDINLQYASIKLEEEDHLGLLIRGGYEFGLGIFVTGVHRNSVAEKLGLKMGDQLHSVNGHNFNNILHSDAVNVLTSNSQLNITFKRLGKIPYSPSQSPSCTYKRQNVYSSTQMDHQEEITMVHEKGKALLNSSDLSLLMFHIQDYKRRVITIGTLVHSLKKMFDTEEKESLFTEIEELIFFEDLNKYDSLVFQKGKLFERVMEAMNPSKDPSYGATENFDTYENLDGSDYGDSLESDEAAKCISWAPKLPQSVRNCARSFSFYDDTEPLLNRKSNFTKNRKEDILRNSQSFYSPLKKEHCLNGMLSNHERPNFLSSFSEANLKQPTGTPSDVTTVKINKQGNSLGIAIEGGSDTLQHEPRIINIQAGGVAFETAGLRVGQVIKEVDGVCLKGLPHSAVARLISESFGNTRRKTLTLAVSEYRPTPQEMRRSVMLPQ